MLLVSIAQIKLSKSVYEHPNAHQHQSFNTIIITAFNLLNYTILTLKYYQGFQLGLLHKHDARYKGQHVFFPSKHLPPKLECGIESLSEFKVLDFSMCQFLELVIGVFLWVLCSAALVDQLMVTANEIKVNIHALSTLSELSSAPSGT